MTHAPLKGGAQKTERNKRNNKTNQKNAGPGASRPVGVPLSHACLTHAHTRQTRLRPATLLKPDLGGPPHRRPATGKGVGGGRAQGGKSLAPPLAVWPPAAVLPA